MGGVVPNGEPDHPEVDLELRTQRYGPDTSTASLTKPLTGMGKGAVYLNDGQARLVMWPHGHQRAYFQAQYDIGVTTARL